MKHRNMAIILAVLFGSIGAHRFYLGQTRLGIFYLLFCWTFVPLFIGIVDAFVIAFMSITKFNERYNLGVSNSILYPQSSTKSDSKVETKLLTVKESEQLIKKSLIDKKDVSFDINADDIDELANKFPNKKLYLQGPIFIKIQAVPHYKAYASVMDHLGEHWPVENVADPDTNKTYHIIRAKVNDMFYRSDLAQTLIPLSRATKIQYRGADYPVSEFKNAIYQYKEGFIDKLEDNFDPAKKNKVWEPANTKTVTPSVVQTLDNLNFVAFDFETANSKRSSACSIGVVVVKDGVITERIHRLINPGAVEWGTINMAKHGIKPFMVKDSPAFPIIWEELEPYFQFYPVIAHNAASFDISVLRACLSENGITPPAIKFGCTMKGAQSLGWPPKLKDLCKVKGIELDHHNALSDAEACAHIAISMFNETQSLKAIDIQEFRY